MNSTSQVAPTTAPEHSGGHDAPAEQPPTSIRLLVRQTAEYGRQSMTSGGYRYKCMACQERAKGVKSNVRAESGDALVISGAQLPGCCISVAEARRVRAACTKRAPLRAQPSNVGVVSLLNAHTFYPNTQCRCQCELLASLHTPVCTQASIGVVAPLPPSRSMGVVPGCDLLAFVPVPSCPSPPYPKQ